MLPQTVKDRYRVIYLQQCIMEYEAEIKSIYQNYKYSLHVDDTRLFISNREENETFEFDTKYIRSFGKLHRYHPIPYKDFIRDSDLLVFNKRDSKYEYQIYSNNLRELIDIAYMNNQGAIYVNNFKVNYFRLRSLCKGVKKIPHRAAVLILNGKFKEAKRLLDQLRYYG